MSNPKSLREAAEDVLTVHADLAGGESMLRLRTALARDEAERAEIVAVLGATYDATEWCSFCRQNVSPHHAPGCRLYTLLRRLGSE